MKSKETIKTQKGGKREGAGRKPNAEKQQIKNRLNKVNNFFDQKVELYVFDANGKVDPATKSIMLQRIKVDRTIALLNSLYDLAVVGKNVQAHKELLDRSLGKAKEKIEVEDTEGKTLGVVFLPTKTK